MRGQLEVMTNDLDQAQKRQRDFYVDLDTRLRKIGIVRSDCGRQPVPAAVDPANETRDHEAALNLSQSRETKEAANGFVAFIKAYPKSSFLPSAHFLPHPRCTRDATSPKPPNFSARSLRTGPMTRARPTPCLVCRTASSNSGDKRG